MKCRIKWIDSEGNETPDDNEAIGYAVVTFQGPEMGLLSGTKGRPIPICAAHAKRAEGFSNWKVTPLPSGTSEADASLLAELAK